MPELPIALQRSLLSPDIEALRGMQRDLVAVVGQYIPPNPELDLVRFTRPECFGMSVIGANMIERIREKARSGSELPNLDSPNVAARIMVAIAATATRQVTAHKYTFKTTGHKNNRRYFASCLSDHTINQERIHSSQTLHALAGLKPPQKMFSFYVNFVQLRTASYNPELEAKMAAVANDHFPPGTTSFAFDQVEPVDHNRPDDIRPLATANQLNLSR